MEPHASLRLKFGEGPLTTYRLTGLVVHSENHFYVIVSYDTPQSGVQWLTKSAMAIATFESGSLMKGADHIQASLPNGVRSWILFNRIMIADSSQDVIMIRMYEKCEEEGLQPATMVAPSVPSERLMAYVRNADLRQVPV